MYSISNKAFSPAEAADLLDDVLTPTGGKLSLVASSITAISPQVCGVGARG